MPNIIIVGIGSDIGKELAIRFQDAGWVVYGTYHNTSVEGLFPSQNIIQCNILRNEDIENVAAYFLKASISWDLIIFASGTVEPIGPFMDCSAEDWNNGIKINALAPLEILRKLMPLRNTKTISSAIFFSGAGTNTSAPSYSAYSASKIFLIKMCELLDSEINDAKFCIIGPGIVKTKIHKQTLDAGILAGNNKKKVEDFLSSENSGTSHNDIFDCISWCHSQDKNVIGGRNISLVFDAWRNGGSGLSSMLSSDENMYKLRRFGNEVKINKGN